MPPTSNHVEQIMGTAISLEVAGDEMPPATAIAFARLREADERFSPFKSGSEVSRLLRGEIRDVDCSLDLRRILAEAEVLRERTGGYFDIRGHRPDRRPDPTGLVKGWALEEASWILAEAGIHNFCLNGGGDVVTRGRPGPGGEWTIGIRHPEISDALVAVLRMTGESVATSGAYERGNHIVDPYRQAPAQGLRSVSIVGPSLTTADALATAVFAMGRPGVDWMAQQEGYGVFAVTETGEALHDAYFGRLLVAIEPLTTGAIG